MYYGDFAEDDTVQIIFNTFTSDDPSASCTITNLVAGDIKIHKDGAVGEKASSDGVTVTINFDGITGNHLVTIDTSNNTGAAGFWVTGSEYQVRMEGTTVDGATINAWIGAFSIERAGGVLALLKAGTVDVNTKTITNGIIAMATFAADIGSTVYANNKIALAVRKVLDEINLDHLMKVAVGNKQNMTEVVDATVLAHILTKTDGDMDDFDPTTDSLEAIRDKQTDIETDTHELQTNQGNWATAVSTTCSDKTGFSLSAAGNTAVIDDFETQSAADPTGFKVNVMEVNGTGQTANDNGADINAILTDTGSTLDTLIKDIPTNAEFALRTLVAANYVVVGDTIAGVTAVTNDVGITQAGADKAWGTAVRVLTAGTNLNDISTVQVNAQVADVLKTDTLGEPAQGAPGATLSIESKIAYIYKWLRNKITNDGTDIKVYNDAGAVVDHKAPVSEAAGTVTRGEFVTGP